ncbi:MAG: CgeB family protein [Pseudomonadota bacterium]
MKLLCVFGRHNYGDPARGEGYEYSNFLPALRALGHEVHHFESWDRDAHADFAALNTALIDQVEALRPDLLFCVLMGYEVWTETLASVRDAGVPVLNWGTDDSWKYAQFSRFVAPEVDLWVTTAHEAMEAAGRDGLDNFCLSQWAASGGRSCEPLSAEQCAYDLSFVGSAYGNRGRWIRRLHEHGLNVECFGQGWPNGPVDAERIPELYRRSRISLNFGDSGLQWRGLKPYRSRQIKARVFEVPAAGGVLLTERADRLGDYYDCGREIETFADEQDLIKRARALLGDPRRRDAMAWAGYRRTLAEHLYERRFAPLLDSCVRVERLERHPIDRAALARAVRAHRSNLGLQALRAALVWPMQRMWGERRGTRAARRLLFELSWRLCGAATYRASGLPGRLFYRDS